MSQIATRIVGTGLGAPSRVVSNVELAKTVDTSDEWITTRTGIRSRHILDKNESNSSIGIKASEQALKRASLEPSDIELVIYCTMTPDTFMPNTASRVIGALKMSKAAGFDLNTACTGFVSGISMADGLIRGRMFKRILVIGSEAMSPFIDWKDRRTCVLFGDGAGAVIVEGFESGDERTESRIIGSKLYVQYDGNGALTVPGGGSRVPSTHPAFQTTDKPYMDMNGSEVFKLGTRAMIEAGRNLMESCGYKLDDVRWLVPHQANQRMIDVIARTLNVGMDRVFTNLDRWGNTTAGTIPIALAEMVEKNLLSKGDLVLLSAFGGGFNYGAVLLRW